jgi:hypothetical protein
LAWLLAIAATLLVKQSCSQVLEIELRRSLSLRVDPSVQRGWWGLGGETFVQLAIAALVVGGLAMIVVRRIARARQIERNEVARRLADEATARHVEELRSGRPVPPFVLYLRPFRFDGRLDAVPGTAISPPFTPSFFMGIDASGFEEYLTQALKRSSTPMIALGPEGSSGGGRIPTADSEWRQRFMILANAASAIAFVPGEQQGVVEELRYLRREGLLWKALFFKPRGYSKEAWTKLGHLLDEEGIELPRWGSRMLSFRLYDSGRVHDTVEWHFYPRFVFMRDRGPEQLNRMLIRDR